MSGLSASLSFMSLRLSKMWFELRIKLVCSHSGKCLKIEPFRGSECSDDRVAKFLSGLPMYELLQPGQVNS